MTEYVSVSIPKHLIPLWEKFLGLKWIEKTNDSALIVKACLEYLQNHQEGNPNYPLEKWSDPDFLAIPAYMAPESNWQEFYSNVSEETYKKIDNRLNWFLRVHNDKMF